MATIKIHMRTEETKSPKWNRLVPANSDWDQCPTGAINVRTASLPHAGRQYTVTIEETPADE